MAILPTNQIHIIMPKGGSRFRTSRPAATERYHSGGGSKSGSKSGSKKSK